MTELSPELESGLAGVGLDPAVVERVIRTALAEDLTGGPDVTTAATIPASATGRADIVARSPGVVAGLLVADAVFELACGSAGSAVSVQESADAIVPEGLSRRSREGWPTTTTHYISDGHTVSAGQVLMTVEGNIANILTAERTALNLLCHMSGVASVTRQWADAVAGTRARVRDTRKTLPGLRALEKYAVRCGGGVNHRMSLSDAALIKDNHVAAAGSVTAAFGAVRRLAPDVPVEVECDTLGQVQEAVAAGAGLILLDNFTVEQMAKAVALAGGRALLEASGGLQLETAGAVAATGVDFLSVGALTHSARALDIGLDLSGA